MEHFTGVITMIMETFVAMEGIFFRVLRWELNINTVTLFETMVFLLVDSGNPGDTHSAYFCNMTEA